MEEPQNNTPETGQTTNEESVIQSQKVTTMDRQAKPPIHRRITKKLSLAIVTAVALVASGAYAFYNINNRNTPPAATSPSINVIKQEPNTSQKTSPYFYLATDTKSVNIYNADTKTKSKIAITAGKDEAFFIGGSSGVNRSVQISLNGQSVAYSTAKQINCGEGCDITDTFIYVKSGEKAEQIVKIAQPQMLDDWVMSSDAKSIFYLIKKDSSKAAEFDLRKINLADKKDTLLKQNAFDSASAANKTPMFVLGNDSFRIYDNQIGVNEYRYENGNLTSKNLEVNKFCGDCRVEYGQPLSPDGKTLILESGSISGTFSYYTLDLANGGSKQIVKTAKPTEQLLNVYWSPNGKAIAYDITANGIAGQDEVGFKFRFETYDIEAGKTTVGLIDPSPGVGNQNYNKHFVNLLGWSPDSAYLAVFNNDVAKLYKLTDASTTDTGIGTESPIGSNVSFGWYIK